MRDVDKDLQAACDSGLLRPALLVMLTFKSATKYIWTGIGNLVVDSQTYVGVGSLGDIETIVESLELRSDGTSVSLSGIDPALYAECMTDIQIGAPAKVWFAALTENGQVIGTPYLMFAGQIDQPTVEPGVDEIKITLALESRMSDFNRPTNRRYTAEDQNQRFPTDTSLHWVPVLQDIALRWG